MLMLSASYYYFSWYISLLLMVLGFFALFTLIVYYNVVWSLSFDVGSFGGFCFEFSVMMDCFSSFFSFVVSLITLVVISFSSYYMAVSIRNIYFMWLKFMFVLSMLLVINMSSLPMLVLGWDGLGIVSFMLIIFYQNSSSLYSGIFTVLMNRLGDGLIMFCIPWVYFLTPFDFAYGYYMDGSVLLCLCLGVAFMTKSALFPFSSWLPAAMAAPTPISSLVHSSTLVTAGLYLLMRFSSYLYTYDSLIVFLLVSSIFTSFYAGMNSLVEVDLKKMVALSTLSHLGFIGLAFSSGFVFLSFLHLIAHAFFKSVLFMTVGNFMVVSNHYQESRYLSSSGVSSFYSSSVMFSSVASLMGFPFMSGFYSKDMVLEFLGFSALGVFVQFVVYMNLIFTYIYTMRLFLSVTSWSKVSSYLVSSSQPGFYIYSLTCLSVISVLGSSFFLWVFYPVNSVALPFVLKFFPFVLSVVVFIGFFLLGSLNASFKVFTSKYLVGYFSSMMYLTSVLSSFSSVGYYSFSSLVVKTFELGLLNVVSNLSFSSLYYVFFSWFSSSFFKVFSWLVLSLAFFFVLL